MEKPHSEIIRELTNNNKISTRLANCLFNYFNYELNINPYDNDFDEKMNINDIDFKKFKKHKNVGIKVLNEFISMKNNYFLNK